MNARELLESGNVIKANPFLASYRTLRFAMFFVAVLMLALILFILIGDTLFGGGRHLLDVTLQFTPTLILLAFYLTQYTLQGRYWERIERRRFAAVQGNQLFLAAEQPTLDRAPLPLPITMKLRPNKGTFLWGAGVILLMALLFAGWLTWVFSYRTLLVPNHLLFFLVVFSIVAVIILVLLFGILLSPVGRPRITVTEGGLISNYGRKVIMPWYEARLFAMYGAYGKQKSGAAITYELSSARDIVRWTWVLRRTLSPGLEPVIPQDEYNRQMQALLSFVVARTGLPLYDLREDLPRGEPKD
jgi:hypothetical protein